MRRAALAALAALACVGGSVGGVAGAAHHRGARPAQVGVGEREWRIALYRRSVHPGRVRLNARNFGEDVHDLAVRTRSGRVLASRGELRPGATGSLALRVRRPGRYVVFCTLAGHEARGMRATLRVVRRR